MYVCMYVCKSTFLSDLWTIYAKANDAVVRPFKSETFKVVLSQGAICILAIYEIKFGHFEWFWLWPAHLV